MKIAVSSTGKDLDSNIDPRFGRCKYFVIVDTEDMSFEVFENQNMALGGGAGIQAAQFVCSKGVKAVITGNCGPNAEKVLNAAKIEVIVGESGTIREAIERFKKRELEPFYPQNVSDHYQMASKNELEDLKDQAERLKSQLEEIQAKIQKIERSPQRAEIESSVYTRARLRIAVPVNGNILNPHFGHSESFLIVDVEDGQIKNSEFKVPPPHEPGVLPNWMETLKVDLILAGGMGRRALSLFEQKGISVVVGAPQIDAIEAVERFLSGTLSTGQNVCEH